MEHLFEGPPRKGRSAIHPYAAMAAGEIVAVDYDLNKMQRYAHVYGHNTGKKFRTRKHEGKLYVKRIS